MKSSKDSKLQRNNPKRTNLSILDFQEFLNKEITIYLSCGRIVVGVVKSYDYLTNLVLDDAFEVITDSFHRELGLIFLKGSNVFLF